MRGKGGVDHVCQPCLLIALTIACCNAALNDHDDAHDTVVEVVLSTS